MNTNTIQDDNETNDNRHITNLDDEESESTYIDDDTDAKVHYIFEGPKQLLNVSESLELILWINEFQEKIHVSLLTNPHATKFIFS